ncbi:MAG TPA: pitrilysin family protein [Candidatus Paceibacterota bacterium]|nr:pitrilysin family protein [Candidatus Paceibacterota bacterium]
MEQQGFLHEVHTFPSGLRLLTVPMPAAKTATVFVQVSAGSTYETERTSGVAHFLEHMMFKGTERRPGYLDISQELDRLGASYNAFTSKEWTGYYAKVAAAKLDVAMDVVCDIFLNSKLEQGAMDIERGPIIEELRMREDDPRQNIGYLFEKLLWGDQPAGWEIGGTPDTIRAMKRQDLLDYFDSHYIAENTVVTVAGNIDPAYVRERIGKHLAHIRNGERAHREPTKDVQTEPALLVHPKDVEQAYVQLGVRAFDRHDDRRYALALMAAILGGGMSSRLFDEIREKRGLAYYVYASNTLYSDTGYFEVGVGANRDKADDAVKAILEELAKVREHGVTEEELARVKDRAEGGMALALEHSDGVAESYSESLLFHGQVLTPEEELAKVKAVTTGHIRKVAEDIFRPERLNLAVTGPFKDGHPFEGILKL